MWILLFFVLSSSSLLANGFGNDVMLGKGEWLVLNILQCEDAENYDFLFTMTRRKINRTHDCFSLVADLDREINHTYSIEVLAYKEVDGGFKFYNKITDECFCNFVTKYGGENWIQILTMAKIDPPTCPIPVGELKIVDFVMNYRELAENGIYGTYDAYIYLLYMGERVGCARWLVQFDKITEHDDDDDDDDYS